MHGQKIKKPICDQSSSQELIDPYIAKLLY